LGRKLRSCLAKIFLLKSTAFEGMVLGYPSDLKDREWQLIEHHFQPEDRRGSASKHPRRRIVEAV